MRANKGKPPADGRIHIRFAEAEIADLNDRLARTRFGPPPDDGSWHFGVPSAVLRDWVDAWRRFDWRAAEARLNVFEHYRVVINDVPIHFMYRRGKGPKPIPIILTHGWPWTFWDWHETVAALADPAAHGGDASDAFDVIVPSLPGFGFSTPLTRGDINHVFTAELWVRLMIDVLGYDRFAAAGGDMGNLVTAQLGHAHADRLIGIHLLGAIPLAPAAPIKPGPEGPWVQDWGFPKPATPPADPVLAALPTSPPTVPSAHRTVHIIEPQTLAAALHDSPAGMLAWLLKARHHWSDNQGDVRQAFSEEFLLTTFSIYWFTDSIGSSMRAYRVGADHPWQPSHARRPIVEAPTGISFFEHDQTSRSRFWAADYYRLVATNYHPTGGHFSPAEVPGSVVEDIRATFRLLR
jgi:pimeloyl-ACP methyl ester carboxylesterase